MLLFRRDSIDGSVPLTLALSALVSANRNLSLYVSMDERKQAASLLISVGIPVNLEALAKKPNSKPTPAEVKGDVPAAGDAAPATAPADEAAAAAESAPPLGGGAMDVEAAAPVADSSETK